MQVYEMPADMVNTMLLIHLTAEQLKSEELDKMQRKAQK